MNAFDKAKDRAEQTVGEAKEELGQATDDKDLEAAGKRDRLKGEAKETAHDLRDKATKAVQDAKDRLRGK